MAKRAIRKGPTPDENPNVVGPPSPTGAVGGGQPGFDTYGISGLTRYGTISRVYEEFLRELQGPQGMKSYREMVDNCPIVGAIMFAAMHLCRKVSFKFKPVNSSPEARDVANFVGSCIFDDMNSSWPDTLSEILTMLPFGWAAMEFRMKRRMGMDNIVGTLMPPDLGSQEVGGVGYKERLPHSRFKDGRVGFRDWGLRSQETLFMWEFDEDSNAVVLQQMAPPDYRIRRIPLSKTFLFRTQVAKNNPEGRSVLRNAWTSYYMKKNLQVFEGIGVERDLAGYPMIQIEKPDMSNNLPVPDIWNTKDSDMVALLATMKKIVRSVRRDEQEGIVMPWWAKFSLVSTGSRRSFDTNAIIGRYDQRIAMSMMADFIMLGHEAVGSKALAATKISLFTSALSSFLDVVKAIIDRQATPMLLQFNGIPQELAPQLEHGDVESINIQELGDFISKLAGTGFNPLSGFDAQKAVMEAARLPTTDIVDPNDADVSGEIGDSTSDNNRSGAPVDPQGTTVGSPSVLTAKFAKMEEELIQFNRGFNQMASDIKKHFDMHVPAPPQPVTIHHHAAAVTVAPAEVNVHPPNIQIHQPDQHHQTVVEPAEVNIHVGGEKKVVKRTVERDSANRITSIKDEVE